MNGRVYSPETGRFLSPDPLVQAPGYSQSFNRCSDVWNNPLNNIDPSGYAQTPAIPASSDTSSSGHAGTDNGGGDGDGDGDETLSDLIKKMGYEVGQIIVHEGRHYVVTPKGSKPESIFKTKVIGSGNGNKTSGGPTGEQDDTPTSSSSNSNEQANPAATTTTSSSTTTNNNSTSKDSWKKNVQSLEKHDGASKEFKPKAEKLLKALSTKGYKLRLIWVKRTKKQNDDLVKLGKAKKNSEHLKGDAMDFVNRSLGYNLKKDSKYLKDVEQASKDAGLEWGGSWTEPWDPNHVELK